MAHWSNFCLPDLTSNLKIELASRDATRVPLAYTTPTKQALTEYKWNYGNLEFKEPLILSEQLYKKCKTEDMGLNYDIDKNSLATFKITKFTG